MFEFEDLMSGVTLVTPKTYGDDRGFFRETFKASEFAELTDRPFVQANVSRSNAGVLRGLHFQTEPAQVAKLVGVVAGSLFDVAVDVRRESGSFGHWTGAVLTAERGQMLYVPRGFAHGFLVLEDNTVASYLMDGEFSPDNDTGISPLDPEVDVDWGRFYDGELQLSPKDEAAVKLLDHPNLP